MWATTVERRCHLGHELRKSLFLMIVLINLAVAESETIHRPHIIFVLADDLVCENVFIFF